MYSTPTSRAILLALIPFSVRYELRTLLKFIVANLRTKFLLCKRKNCLFAIFFKGRNIPVNRLKDRLHHIPGGFRFVQPETNWRSRNWTSFDTIVDELIAHRRANPALVARYGWATDKPNVANEVEAFNVRLCEQYGWTSFITSTGGDAPYPKSYPPHQAMSNLLSAKLVVGAKSLVDWSISGEVVPQEQAEARAIVCAACKENRTGELQDIFTAPAFALIKKELEIRNERKLKTEQDEKINFCDACGCPLKLKVHCPTEVISKYMTAEMKKDLDKSCWILKELP